MTGSEQSLSHKMQAVRGIFESRRQQAAGQENIGDLFGLLNAVQPEYRTVAYEAASMGLYQRDLKAQGRQALWPLFLDQADAIYVPDIYTGLGCAMAQEDISIFPFIDLFDKPLHYRIVDGYGFYKGLFRARQTLQQQYVPEGLDKLYLGYYDQGLGRSLWYNSGGDCDKIGAAIGKFAAGRQAELWRGIGIAASYLGGCDEATLNRVLTAAAGHHPQLLAGAAISARARIQSQTSGADMELTCKLWCHMPAAEASALAEKCHQQAGQASEKSYGLWVSALDQQLMPAGLTNS